MKLLQINVTANWGSTGKIAEDIGKLAINDGWESWIAYGRGEPTSASKLIRVGNDRDMKLHGIQSRLFDNHGLASKHVTKEFIKQIEEIGPDVIHLHNIHGYYLNYPVLFDYLKKWGGPVIWTLHDCWPFTGHCAYYDYAKCDRWMTQCHDCPQLKSYPTSLLWDNSKNNFQYKKYAFLGSKNLTFVPVSDWLRNELSKSFLSGYNAVTIHNGIDVSKFCPSLNGSDIRDKYGIGNDPLILGVASVWDKRKGLDEFIELRKILPTDYKILLVGLSEEQIRKLPQGIIGISRTNNVDELIDLYSAANVFANPTLEDNFPTTNIEALSCGTPVVTYKTGGSPEAVSEMTGLIVDYKDIEGLNLAVQQISSKKASMTDACRNRAEEYFNQEKNYNQYIELYHSIINK